MKKEILHIALVQAVLHWENPEGSKKHLESLLETLKPGTDLVFLPEMFSTGFTMNPSIIAEPMNGPTHTWMKQIASKKGVGLGGSMVIEENGKFYNRFLFVFPDGTTEHYDKKHTFTLAGEDQVYEAGNEIKTVDFLGWKICLQICYDLRFPVWARNVKDYDVLVFVANWPAPRINAWDTLLQARAIENMSYCIGVNRVGEDAEGHLYPGHSAVYDVLGKQQTFSQTEEILYTTLNQPEIYTLRNKLKFLQDRDTFSLK